MYELSKQVKFMLPLFLVQFLEAISGWVDSVILGAYIYEAMGAYSNISFLAKTVFMANSAMYFVIVPVFARQLLTGDKAKLIGEYRRRTHHLALIASPPAVFLVIYAPELPLLLFSIKVQSMAIALQILAVGYLGATLLGPILALTLAHGNTRQIFYSTLIFLSANTLLSLLLTPNLGVVGASIAAACGYLSSIMFLAVRCQYRYQLFSYRAALYAISVGIVLFGMNLILTAFGLGTIKRIILGVLILVMLSIGGYLAILASSQEKLLIKRLCHVE